MPAPTVDFEVVTTSSGRRIAVGQATESINLGMAALFQLIEAIPAGPQGPSWGVGAPRAYAEDLACVVGSIVWRQFPTQRLACVFRSLAVQTTSAANFPASPAANAGWDLVLAVPFGESAEIVEFATDSAAIAYSTAHPLALVISTQGAA
ncbi:hypothetical protein [Paracoccus litorisediminis]|uniref:Uncharacterized protein n=1 Tax=Paracoccus litorisediminis TaxID=2006130 RepID=A0A844HQF6_9RHOB|nr:hypothetical protein [Paracoccus litorisediminis]MTH62120.1 hypothetical protein [Paracoccus litorisediminis]